MILKKKQNSSSEENISIFREALIFLWELIKVIVISLAIIIPVRYFLIQPFYVKGASMEPTFEDHEYLIIDEISYRFRKPKRGEVVVFRYPVKPQEYFIKRIIGLPGEKIKVENNQVIIYNNKYPDGVNLQEKYLPNNLIFSGSSLVKLDKDEYFLLGDNRDESLDSRAFGAVSKKFVTGRVLFRGWPISKINFFFEAPAYGL